MRAREPAGTAGCSGRIEHGPSLAPRPHHRASGPRSAVAWLAAVGVLSLAAVALMGATANGTAASPVRGAFQPSGPAGGSAGGLIASVAVGKNPLPPVLDPANGEIYVANYDVANVSVISGRTDSVIGSIPTSTQPVSPAIDPVSGSLYVPTEGTNNVTVVSGATNAVVTTIAVPAVPLPLTPVYDPDNGELYVTSALSTNVVALSGTTNAVVAIIAVPGHPLLPTVDNATGAVYVPIEGTNNVSVISGSTNRVMANLSVGTSYLQTAAYDSANGELYFPELSGVETDEPGAVIVVSGSTNEVVATIPVGQLPQTPVVDPANGDLFVANYGSNNVSVISGATNAVIATVVTGLGPNVPAFDAGNGDLYVSNVGSNNVTVVSGMNDSDVTAIPVGLEPEGAVYDAAEAAVYVANRGSNNVSVLADGTAPTYEATFTESGLPTGAAWAVTVAGVGQYSTAGTVVFHLPDGEYSYSVAGTSGCVAAHSQGTAAVDGAPSTVTVRFGSGACAEWLGLPVRDWAIGASVGAVVLVAFAGLRRALVSRARRQARVLPTAPAPGTGVPAPRSDTPASVMDSVAGRFRQARHGRRRQRYAVVLGVAVLVVVAYLLAVPVVRPSSGSPLSEASRSVVHLGNVTLGVVPCGAGPSAVAERIAWVNASSPFTTEQIVLVVVDLDGDTLWSSGPLPTVTPSSACAGSLPMPNWTAVSGVNVGFSWYVVLSGPTGVNLAYYTLTNGWLPVASGPWPVPIQNGSALTFICNPSISRLGAYQLEATYHLEVGLIVGAAAGSAIVGSADL